MNNAPLKWIDIPPVWLVALIIATYLLGQSVPTTLSVDHPVTQLVAGLLIGAGLILMLLAVTEMRKHSTTVIPHLEADHLVQSGIFKRSRNPIYLGDVLVLAGLILRWDVVIALPLIPLLAWILQIRFIIPEENRLRRKFRQDFFRYSQKTRRWF